MCLLHLLVSWDIVQTAILAEVGTRLFKVERHVGCDALLTDAKHPGIITDTGLRARLTTNSHLFTPRAKIIMKDNALQ